MLPFVKMQAVGNDFVVVERGDAGDEAGLSDLARALCDRRFGVGADGLLLRGDDPDADLEMRIFNADGSEDTMCGNGLRCLVRLAHDRGLAPARGIARTRAGCIPYAVGPEEVALTFAPPAFAPADVPVDAGSSSGLTVAGVRLDAVNTGSTHAVALVDALPGDALFRARSPRIETDPRFPERTSVIWTRVEGPGRLRVRIWERGVGETQGCGTGACAAAVVARRAGVQDAREIRVASPGGELRVAWEGGADDPMVLTGPAQVVYEGVWDRGASR